jgi:hypothetical protein
MSHSGLVELATIVEEFCSDDKTIAGDTTSSEDTSTGSDDKGNSDAMDCDDKPGSSKPKKKGKSGKKFAVRQMVWHNPRLKTVMRQIDYHLSGKRTAVPKKACQQRTRLCTSDSNKTDISPPKRQPGNCFNSDWLKTLKSHDRKYFKFK